MRQACPADLPGAYTVCLQTGDAGQDASGIRENPDLLGHNYVGPYLAADMSLCLVVVDQLGVGGYLLATDDTREFEAWREAHWLPVLREQYPRGSTSPRDADLVELLHAPEIAPQEVVAEHPAHLHIDLLPRLQGQGWGRRLVQEMLARLADRGSPAVHLGVATENLRAQDFYRHLGFADVAAVPDALYMGRPTGPL